MYIKRLLFFIAILIILLFTIFTNSYTFSSIKNSFKYTFYNKNNLVLKFNPVNPGVKYLAAEPSNRLVFRLEVFDKEGNPVPGVFIKLYVNNKLGIIHPSETRTGRFGESLVSFIPDYLSGMQLSDNNTKAVITAKIYKSDRESSVSVLLTKVPVIFIHGYLENSEVFTNLKEYLSVYGYDGVLFDYKSEEGVIPAAHAFKKFLQQQKDIFLSRGIQVGKFNLISHSMGGLVARYYTCNSSYLINNDVDKILFLSVPQKGSPWAPIGLNYFNNQGIRDLFPDSRLFTNNFPKMLNKGLNNKIQSGSILGLYDEVVSLESASLDEWNIETKLFNVGEKSLTMNDILNGNLMEAQIHKAILNNKKVFEEIKEMLDIKLPYPVVK